jgi:hypothetical protein
MMLTPQAWVRDGARKSLAVLRPSCTTTTCDVTLLNSLAMAPKNTLDDGY